MTTFKTDTIPRQERVDLILNQLDQLPTLPEVATRVLQVTTDENSSAKDVIELIQHDQSLTAKVLSMVGKAAVGAPRAANTIAQAVVLLGFDAIRHAVLSIEVFETFSGMPGAEDSHFKRGEFWKHSLAVACAAHLIAGRRPGRVDPEIAYVCGLLHDIGKVALDACLPKSYDRVVQLAGRRDKCIIDVERELLGVDHTVAGKHLAQRWNFPQGMTESIWLHHQAPEMLPDAVCSPELVHIVLLANVWVREQRLGYSGYIDDDVTSRGVARQIGMPVEQLDDIAPILLDMIEQRAGLIGLDDLTSGELYAQAVTRSNAELSRLNTALACANNQLDARSDYLDLIHRFNTAQQANFSLTDICHIGAACARELLDLDAAVVFTRHPQSNIFHTGMSTENGHSVEVFSADVPSQDESVSSVVIKHPRLIVAPQCSSAVRERLGPDLGPAPYWMLPVVDNEEVWGGVLFHATQPQVDCFNRDNNQLIMFATALGNALVNAHQRVRSERLNEGLAEVNRQLKSAQKQLLRTRSLAMIGEMSAGAAHELNNPLAVIAGRAEMLSDRVQDDDVRKDLHIISDQANRCSGIVAELMAFAKPQPPDRRLLEFSALLQRIVGNWLEKSSLSAEQIRLELSDEHAAVYADSEQIEQVFEDLIKNAFEAIDGQKGLISINCQCHITDEIVVVTVMDNGCGMSAEVLEKARAPFFSHRPAGRGRGLGLSKAVRLCEINDGNIRIQSRPGEGTTVWVELPMAERLSNRPGDRTAHGILKGMNSKRMTILVVEDDDHIADMVVDHLQATVEANVLRTSNASETIRLDLDEPPDLMLTDILLPDGNGLDLIRLIRSSRDYPVLVMTGQPSMGRAIEAMRLGVSDLFTKPFDLRRLTCVVKESLADATRKKNDKRRIEKLEKLTRKVIVERKELKQRMDLVCKDLVSAYRDLAEHVAYQRYPEDASEN